MINDISSALESMSAPIERRLELLKRVAAVFDQIDATSRSELDPARSAPQVRAEVQTQLILSRALEELGDIQGAIHRTGIAEFQARKLSSRPTAGPDDQLILAEVLLEKCGAFSKVKNMQIATGFLEEAASKLRELDALGNLTANFRRKLEVLLCDALIQNVNLTDELANPEHALKLLTQAVHYGEQAYTAQPTDREALNAYASALENLGGLYYNWGRFKFFGEPVRKALTLRRKAAAAAPADIGLRQHSEKAIAHWASLLALGDPQDQEIVAPGESLAIQRRLCAADPSNVDLSEELIGELANDASILADQREYEKAEKLLKEAVDIGKRLKDEKKRSYDVDDRLQQVAFALSFCYSKGGDLEAARRINLELLVPLTEELKAIDQEKPNNWFREALACIAQAEIANGAGHWEEAQQMYSEALRYLEETIHGREHPYDLYCYGYSVARLGGVLGEAGEAESGCRHIEKGLQILYALRDSERFEPRSSILSDISEAEEALRRFQQEVKNTDGSAGAAAQ
jgi:tetratricopeptide (TPR) repeat protein